MATRTTIIAKAIKTADKSWFNENYTKQAEAVIKTLEGAGYMVVPVKPDDKMVKAGKEAMQAGRFKSSEVVSNLYAAMVRATKS